MTDTSDPRPTWANSEIVLNFTMRCTVCDQVMSTYDPYAAQLWTALHSKRVACRAFLVALRKEVPRNRSEAVALEMLEERLRTEGLKRAEALGASLTQHWPHPDQIDALDLLSETERQA